MEHEIRLVAVSDLDLAERLGVPQHAFDPALDLRHVIFSQVLAEAYAHRFGDRINLGAWTAITVHRDGP